MDWKAWVLVSGLFACGAFLGWSSTGRAGWGMCIIVSMVGVGASALVRSLYDAWRATQ